MKKNLLLGISLLLSASFVQAQWTNNISWDYSFGTGTGTWNTVGTNSSSTSTTPGFLPTPPNGIVGVYLNGVAASGGFTLNGDNTLTEKLPTVSMVRFSANSIPSATDVVMNSFKIKFSGSISTTDAGYYLYAIGNHKGNLFNVPSNNSIYRTSNELFAVLRWIPTATANSTTIKFDYRKGSSASTTLYTEINQTTFVKGNEYTVDIYCNNSASDQAYTVGTTLYTIHSNTFQIWVNGTKLGTDFPRSIEVDGTSTDLTSGTSKAILNGEALNAFSITATGGTGATGSVTLTSPKLTYMGAVTPVSLTAFTCKKSTKGAELNWQTESELNNDYFEVLRSENGEDYASIGVIKGNGSTQVKHNYNFTDVNPAKGLNYYQLKQVDFNGTNTSGGKTLAFHFGSNLSEFNLANTGEALKVFLFARNAGQTDFAITDAQGKKVIQVSKTLEKGLNSFDIDISSLQRGVFVAQIHYDQEYKTAKFIKE